MIKKIYFSHYRKLKDISLEFKKGVNIISGTNGTCKTSILHVVSNSFQAVTRSCEWLHDNQVINIIRQVNHRLNQKIETLTRGDKQYNDPANGDKGILYSVEYHDNNPTLEFRKHNTHSDNQNKDRYYLKPKYNRGSLEKLPFLPVIYLGLFRLVTYGEFQSDNSIKIINKKLPKEYLDEIAEIYRGLTSIEVSSINHQNMGDLKIRADFATNKDGVDSNTISAGEDNLYIILTALVSLKYYFSNINSHNSIESILLIDEIDATLHPSMQVKLLNLLREYSSDYKIQIIATSHSLYLLDYALTHKDNVIYLYDNDTDVCSIPDPDIYKIHMYLKGLTKADLFENKKIPILTEDNEARFLANILLDYFYDKFEEFKDVKNFFYFVEANIGADNLKSIFTDINLKITTGLICILDGDKSVDYTNRIIVLPGHKSPEDFLLEYAQKLYLRDDKFWKSDLVLEENIGKLYYKDKLLNEMVAINKKIAALQENGQTIHGVKRELLKPFFMDHKRFFKLLFEWWLSDPENEVEIDKFYKGLNILFKKVALINGINPQAWNL